MLLSHLFTRVATHSLPTYASTLPYATAFPRTPATLPGLVQEMEANIAEVSTQLGAIAAALPDAVRAAVREEHQPVTTSLERTISLCEQRLQASGTRITELETEGLVVKKQLQDAFASNAELKTQVRGLEQRLQGIASLNEKLHGATALNTRLKDDFARSSAQFETRLAALESKGVGPKHAEAIVRDEKE